jgi:hypothetical protein
VSHMCLCDQCQRSFQQPRLLLLFWRPAYPDCE